MDPASPPAEPGAPREPLSRDYLVLPAGVALRSDPADADELRGSYTRTVAVVGRGPRVVPVPIGLP